MKELELHQKKKMDHVLLYDRGSDLNFHFASFYKVLKTAPKLKCKWQVFFNQKVTKLEHMTQKAK